MSNYDPDLQLNNLPLEISFKKIENSNLPYIFEDIATILSTSKYFSIKNAVITRDQVYSQDPLEWLCLENLSSIQNYIEIDFLNYSEVLQSQYIGLTWEFGF